MTRIKIIVEGQTEESFISNVLAPSLWSKGISAMPILLGIPGHKGGNVSYDRVKKDILIHLKQDRTAYCTTMFDFYGLRGEFPGMPLPSGLAGLEKASRIERAIYEDIAAVAPECNPRERFWPYLQLHEFEALLFSDPEAFAGALRGQHLLHSFQNIRKDFQTPEDINDLPESCPSKRVTAVYRSYNKVIDGTLAAQAVGIHIMRSECPHFGQWVSLLEGALPLQETIGNRTP